MLLGSARREVLHIYVVYLDTLFFTNFFLDAICLLALGLAERRPPSLGRVLGTAAAGSVLGILCFVVIHDYAAYQLAIVAGVAPLTVFLAFYPLRGREYGMRLLAFYVSYLVLGGALTYVRQWLMPQAGQVAALGACAGALLGISAALGAYRRRRRKYARVVLQNKEATVTCKALLDSGNQLMDPYRGLPVSVVSESVRARLGVEPHQTRLVPFATVEGGGKLMEVATLPAMLIGERGRERAVAPAVIGFAKEEAFGHRGYDMILHGDYINDREM